MKGGSLMDLGSSFVFLRETLEAWSVFRRESGQRSATGAIELVDY